ncbi:hypothetical protein SAMN05518854_103124 [Variovorax sp. YR266]|nr:hypothetical protein SAMN05518854_103124 [Variovorax sp. YR266]
MARIFRGDRIVPTWLEVVNHLDQNGQQGRNFVLELATPQVLTAQDKHRVAIVDDAIRTYCDSSVKTVAATIFPQAMYRRYGRPAFYDAFKDRMVRAKKKNTWGTYALRIMERRALDPREVINPLEQIVTKLIRASTEGHAYHNNYELGVAEPSEDLDPDTPFGCELPTFDVARDGGRVSNMPCLSHLSFKMTGREQVELTAIYRSHHYLSKALGNLIGLSQLLQFVAHESNLAAGTLTCVSTHAQLEPRSWGDAAHFHATLESLVSVPAD